ncbi:hypothetical protein N7493_005515 [Penicillium malachiteum]|uniref:Cytochrome P450 n=1 Tax=Penicillium malachiteum TaxID=1324776 RepID=A0AAD6MWK5_9EURO|nr:hypothetical protein N7493_005515 [Penicillium malachiteum]
MPARSSFLVKLSLWAAITWFGCRLSGIRLESIGTFAIWLCGTWVSYCIIILGWRVFGRQWFSPYNDLPGPKPLGHQITQWVNTIPNDGLLHFFGFLGAEYLITTNVESLSDVLTNRSYLFQKTSGLRRWTVRFFGEGIVIQEGEKHKQNRKSFVQVFNQRQVDKLKPILSGKSTQIVDRIEERCTRIDKNQLKSAILNVSDLTKAITLDVMGIVALGVDFNTILGQNVEITEVFQTLFSTGDLKKSHFMWHNSAPSWLIKMFPSKIDRQMDDAHLKLKINLERLLKEKLALFRTKDVSDEDILTQIACSGDFTPEEIIPQVVTTLAAGFESTAGTLAWTLYCVAANREVQKSLRQELRDAKATKGQLSEADYEKLPLLNGICNESSRLYPTFAMTMRKATCDTYITGRHVQAGTYIVIVPRAINRAKHLWGADAEEFVPERWIDRTDPETPKINPTGGASSPMSMLSFLYGPRSCVGRSLSLAEIRRMTARIVERFEMETTSSVIPESTGWLSSAPSSDLQLKFTQIDE